MSDNLNKTLVIGAGNMASEYCKVLEDLKESYVVVSKGQENARKLEKNFPISVLTGGIESHEDIIKDFNNAIVAVNARFLSETTCFLINKGIKNILVEKPAGLSRNEIQNVKEVAEEKGANVYVAYNRRFYSSTLKAEDIIDEDGGILSVYFEFTEWSNVISSLPSPRIELETTLLGNSFHVIDLAIYFSGQPTRLSSYITGGLDWHPSGSIYAGAGFTERNIMISYNANWEAPGRWGVEVLTHKHRLYFRPMEKLAIQEIGSVAINEVNLDDNVDINFKPGLHREVEAFLYNQRDKHLITIAEQYDHLDIYESIAGINGKGIKLP